MHSISNEQIFKNELLDIINNNHIPTFEFHSKDNQGVIMNEWNTITDNGVILPNEQLYSGVYSIGEDKALSIINELIPYPLIEDEY